MRPPSLLRALCTLLPLLPLAHTHMQMKDPSPLRDPHSDRTDEPKDYNILTPLRSDGSDFTCKGYQWNTKLTPVATYNAGETYNITLMGSATHGGGSCQISMSCDNGQNFKVLKSIIGGCPMEDSYGFTVPENAQSAQCLLAWTWFNKVGNREMYMNCAVVDIVGAGDRRRSSLKEGRASTAKSMAAAAQAALRSLPDLYVANLANINDCKTKETADPMFDNPGRDVEYGDGVKPSKGKSDGSGGCTGVGRKSAGDSASSSSSSSDSSSSHDDHSDDEHSSSSGSDSGSDSGSSKPSYCNDGKWHAECYGGNKDTSKPKDQDSDHKDSSKSPSKSSSDSPRPSSSPKDSSNSSSSGNNSKSNEKPSKVEKELEQYLGSLDDDSSSSGRPRPSSGSSQSSKNQSKPDSKQNKPGEFYSVSDKSQNNDAQYNPGPESDYNELSPSSSQEADNIPTSESPSEDLEDFVAAMQGDTGDEEQAVEALLDTEAPETDSADIVDNYVSAEPKKPVDIPGDMPPAVIAPANNLLAANIPSGQAPAAESVDTSIPSSQSPPNIFSTGNAPTFNPSSVTDFLRSWFSGPTNRKATPKPKQVNVSGPNLSTPPAGAQAGSGIACEEVKWHCAGCSSPNRCVKAADGCSRVCDRLPYKSTSTALPTSLPITAPQLLQNRPTTASPSPPSSNPASNFAANVFDTPGPAKAPSKLAGSLASPSAPANKSLSNSNPSFCPNATAGFATGNISAYLPCRPGTLLCKSETEFYTCGLSPGGEWKYTAIRRVAEGMACLPRLEEGSARVEARRRELYGRGRWFGQYPRDDGAAVDDEDEQVEEVYGENGETYEENEEGHEQEEGGYEEDEEGYEQDEDGSDQNEEEPYQSEETSDLKEAMPELDDEAKVRVEKLLQQLKDLTKDINSLLSAFQNSKGVNRHVDSLFKDGPGSKDNPAVEKYFSKLRKTLMSMFWMRQWDEGLWSDGSDGGDGIDPPDPYFEHQYGGDDMDWLYGAKGNQQLATDSKSYPGAVPAPGPAAKNSQEVPKKESKPQGSSKNEGKVDVKFKGDSDGNTESNTKSKGKADSHAKSTGDDETKGSAPDSRPQSTTESPAKSNANVDVETKADTETDSSSKAKSTADGNAEQAPASAPDQDTATTGETAPVSDEKDGKDDLNESLQSFYDSFGPQVRKRQEDLPFESTDLSEGGDGLDEDAEGLFGAELSPAHKHSEDKDAEQPSHSEASSTEEYDTEADAISEGSEDGSDPTDSGKDPLPTESAEVLRTDTSEELPPVGISGTIWEEPQLGFRKTQVEPGYIGSDKNGGDGIDTEPTLRFGNEPPDYEIKWPVAGDAAPPSRFDFAAKGSRPVMDWKQARKDFVGYSNRRAEPEPPKPAASGQPPQPAPSGQPAPPAQSGQPAPSAAPAPSGQPQNQPAQSQAGQPQPSQAPQKQPQSGQPQPAPSNAPLNLPMAGKVAEGMVAGAGGVQGAGGPLGAGQTPGGPHGPPPREPDDPGEGTEDAPELLFPDLRSPNLVYDGLQNPNAEDAVFDSGYDMPVETDIPPPGWTPPEVSEERNESEESGGSEHSEESEPSDASQVPEIHEEPAAPETSEEAPEEAPSNEESPENMVKLMLANRTLQPLPTISRTTTIVRTEEVTISVFLAKPKTSTSSPEQTLEDGVLSGVAPEETASPSVVDDALANVWPALALPGPVIPSGVSVEWPGALETAASNLEAIPVVVVEPSEAISESVTLEAIPTETVALEPPVADGVITEEAPTEPTVLETVATPPLITEEAALETVVTELVAESPPTWEPSILISDDLEPGEQAAMAPFSAGQPEAEPSTLEPVAAEPAPPGPAIAEPGPITPDAHSPPEIAARLKREAYIQNLRETIKLNMQKIRRGVEDLKEMKPAKKPKKSRFSSFHETPKVDSRCPLVPKGYYRNDQYLGRR